MRDVVRQNWITFTEPLEGGVSSLYNDVRGLTTIAYGNLCNTPSEAAALPLVHPDGAPATPGEKIAAWDTVHDDPRAAAAGWRYAARLSPLRLTREGMAALAMGRLASNDRIMSARLPEWEEHGACVQMAMHSLAWACGALTHFPRLFQAISDRDYVRAAAEIHMNERTPEGILNAGLVARNIANAILMRNAARIEAFHLSPDTLDWTHDLSVSDEPTLPEIDNPASSPTIHPLGYCDPEPGDEV